MTTYTATVVSEDGYWQADVPDLPGAHAFAKTLFNLRRELADAIILSAELDDDAEVTIDFEMERTEGQDEAILAAFELARVRHRVDLDLAALQRLTGDVATELVGRGLSVREVAGALDITPGRVSQLVARPLVNASRPVDSEITGAIRVWARQTAYRVVTRGGGYSPGEIASPPTSTPERRTRATTEKPAKSIPRKARSAGVVADHPQGKPRRGGGS